MEVIMKKCTKCGLTKSRDEFYSHKRAKDCLHPQCKECSKKSRKRDSKVVEGVSYLDPARKMSKDKFLNWYNSFDKSLLEQNQYILARRG
jgi:hypothetical protein